MTDITKYCITCEEHGHTYVECPRVNFLSLFAGSIGVEPLIGPSREETLQGLKDIEKNRPDVKENL